MKPVIIAGGGIGGLALANCLLRVGIPYQVLEATKTFQTAGYAIGLGDNAMHCLHKINPDLEQRIQNIGMPCKFSMVRGQSGEVFFTSPPPLSGYDKYSPSRFLPMARENLQNELAKDLDPNNIFFRARVRSFTQNEEGVEVKTKDGRTFEGSLLIGADGINSAVRAHLHQEHPTELGPAPEAKFTNFTLFGGETMWTDSYKSSIPLGKHFSWLFHDGKIISILPVEKVSNVYRMMWSVGKSTEEPKSDEFMRLSNDSKQDFLRAYVEEFHPSFDMPTFISSAKRYFAWDISELDRTKENSSRWGHGRVTLLGDAAHAITPWIGQGAGLSIEDGFDLAHRLVAHPEDYAKAVNEYEKVRIPRANTVRSLAHSSFQSFQWCQDAGKMRFIPTIYKYFLNRYTYHFLNQRLVGYDNPPLPLPPFLTEITKE